ncbi:SDR family oxidoreductase [Rhizomicrobium electricum]|uniref:SDR family oxidoreductase n=1 Tax=Rhizomicrobium electricum TaxID=480070 RepID=A0ABN1EUH2_9PROT|nr:SDR family oxidoreductase [Rhizomicrobium electricum]NIJ49614.1 NAD(P)H dehydrogenase (quinone) [Rhizomicrobium electricum]
MTIAVTGATGHLGRLVISALKKHAAVVALARDPAKGADLGVAVRRFDYDTPETLPEALAGIDKLLLISGNELGKRATQHRAVIAAAKKAGVELIAYTSLLRADTTPLDLGPEHAATETALKASGVPFVILRNGWYTENYTASIPVALKNGAFIGSARDGRIASAARADYAEAAVVVLTGEGHAGRTYELAGDTAYTLAELAAELSRQSGKTIPYSDLPPAEFAKALEGAGLPPVWAEAYASMDVAAAKGALFDDGHVLSRLIGRPTTPLGDTIRQILAV